MKLINWQNLIIKLSVILVAGCILGLFKVISCDHESSNDKVLKCCNDIWYSEACV